MSDPGIRITEAEFKRVRGRLEALYREAGEDIGRKLNAFEQGHSARVHVHRSEYKRGEITKADYEAWMRGQVFQREAWKRRADVVARQLVDVDRTAVAMLTEGTYDIFAENANALGWQLETGGGADYGFGVYDRNTVRRLVTEDPDLLPRPRVDADKDYAWYNRIISNSVTQGLIQGEDMDAIMLRVRDQTCDRSYTSMLRNARTAYVGAQNAGRLEGMRQAQALGIEVRKLWMATLDFRTRDSHAALDGQTAAIDKPFHSLLGAIRYPGDPQARPGDVYNCRCTLGWDYPKYPSSLPRRDFEGDVSTLSYHDWMAQKTSEKGEAWAQAQRERVAMERRELSREQLAEREANMEEKKLQALMEAARERMEARARAREASGRSVLEALTGEVDDGRIGMSDWYRQTVGTDDVMVARYQAALRRAKKESRIKGELSRPVIPEDLSEYTFDSTHANQERGHNVTREEALQFIRESVIQVSRNGVYVNYIGQRGSVYTIPGDKVMRTAFWSREYAPDIKKVLEVLGDEFAEQ